MHTDGDIKAIYRYHSTIASYFHNSEIPALNKHIVQTVSLAMSDRWNSL